MFAAEKPEAGRRDTQAPGLRQPTILVADDEEAIRDLVTLLLQDEGYGVLSVSDGQEGLGLSRRYPGTIDLVITDLDMPRLNGMDMCAHLLRERPGIKAIVMSGSDMNRIVGQNINIPFLPKPFDGESLLAQVQKLLGAGHADNKRKVAVEEVYDQREGRFTPAAEGASGA